MTTPPAWFTPYAQTAAHPAAYRQHGEQTRSTHTQQSTQPTVGGGGHAAAAYTARTTQQSGEDDTHMPAYTASRSVGAALYESHEESTAGTAEHSGPHLMYSNSLDALGGADMYAHHFTDTDTDNQAATHVDGLAFGAPDLAEAMVHQEASARESAEQKLDEERARCELLQHEIQRLQAQLTGSDMGWKCPICCTIFPRVEKGEHGKRCLTQFVEFVQSGSPGAGGR
eukprot:COSAG02_NODE_11179_length_1776_cov_1.519380_2_plen_227_part_00